MKLTVVTLLAASCLLAADKKLTIETLPAPVKATAQEQLKGATLVGIASEKEAGKTVYELETKRDGKARDLMIAADGKVLSIEEEVDIAAIPAAARAAIEKMVGKAKLDRVEALSKSGKLVAYEAAYKKSGKSVEAAVTPEGAPYKD